MEQVIIVRSDLKLPKGKLAAQVAHASVDCVLQSSREDVKKWKHDGAKKIVLKVSDLKELIDYEKKAIKSGFVTALITDAGHTVVEAGTTTCLGIGPDDEKKLQALVKDLKLV